MIKQISLNPWVSHFICFILGAAAIFPYEQPCKLDIKGIAIELSNSQKNILDSYERRTPIYPLKKTSKLTCLLSKEAFYLYGQGERLWALFPRKKAALKGIEALLGGDLNQASRGIKAYPSCKAKHRVIYE